VRRNFFGILVSYENDRRQTTRAADYRNGGKGIGLRLSEVAIATVPVADDVGV